jgi:hypothetical protein
VACNQSPQDGLNQVQSFMSRGSHALCACTAKYAKMRHPNARRHR